MDDKPSNIAIDIDGNLIVVGQSQEPSGWKNQTVKYSIFERSLTPVVVNGEPSHVEGELLIRFNKSVVKYSAIDNKRFEAGTLSQFVSQSAISQMSQKVGFNCSNLETFKIYRRMTTADSISVTRLGTVRKMDDFWATLSVYFPKEYNALELADSLEMLTDIIKYVEKDVFAKFSGEPNDELYLSEQTGFFDPVHGINVEDAWDIEVGQEYTKVGVFDTGINWRHEDFGAAIGVGSKIAGGWDFQNNVNPANETTPDFYGHGTAVAGIIGALRNNNNTGIAGIAGGDMLDGNIGCTLYSMEIGVYVAALGNWGTYASVVSPAIIEGAANNPATGYGYGLHIQNHSWGGNEPNLEIKQALRSCFLDNCLFITASGNTGAAQIDYPGAYNEEWTIAVGANNQNGYRASISNYGNGLNVLAPGTPEIFATLDFDDNSGYSYSDIGTSYAAPHVAGVAALMHSQHNVLNGYGNDLAPEDFQMIINKTARDVLPVSYDADSGHGIIDASNTLTQITLPAFFIEHAGGQNQMDESIVDFLTVQNLIVPGASPPYYANIHSVTNSWVHTFDNGYLPIDVWKRSSSSISKRNTNPISQMDPFYEMSYIIDPANPNQVTVSTTAYTWHIIGSLWDGELDIWIPAPPAELRTEYSIHVELNPVSDIRESSAESFFNLYPNPAENNIEIDFLSLPNEIFDIVIVDALGKIVHSEKISNNGERSPTKILNLSGLKNGVYVCTLQSSKSIFTRKFIIQK